MGLLDEKTSNNLTLLNERGTGAGEVWEAGETDVNSFDLSAYSRDQTYPSEEMMCLVHPITRATITPYKPGEIVIPKMAKFFKYPSVCVMCTSSRKKRIVGSFHNNRLLPLCHNTLCAMMRKNNYICVFNEKPTFTVWGLCTNAVMDTQYKFA